MRGATITDSQEQVATIFQSTLLMRGATGHYPSIAAYIIKFQSTLLMRGATAARRVHRQHVPISIHAPHARSDVLTHRACARSSAFQSTLLMRGATAVEAADIAGTIFQSTLLMRGATIQSRRTSASLTRFQSTLLMRGATSTKTAQCSFAVDFNPRSSCEERRTEV